MIFDNFKNLKRYDIPQIGNILEFVAKKDCSNLPLGQIDIVGTDLFVRVMEYVPKPANENSFETHRIHADLQYIVSGVELMQIASSDTLKPLRDYDLQGDCQFFSSNESTVNVIVRAGEFTYFYPNEAHRPSCQYKKSNQKVKKLVFKIKA